MNAPVITYKTMTLAEQPDRRAEFWTGDELILVIHFNSSTPTAETVNRLAFAWLAAALGNCVNICS